MRKVHILAINPTLKKYQMQREFVSIISHEKLQFLPIYNKITYLHKEKKIFQLKNIRNRQNSYFGNY